jgi:N-dimethylarginine dimethylaminohydrolase
MGDPAHFSVKGGANPHTRTRWGTRRRVDRALAIRQWQRLRDTLTDLGIRVLVVPPVRDWPGTVYPANAGFMRDVDAPSPAADKLFTLANLLPTRAGEKDHYRAVLIGAGIPTREIDERWRFEGEADFFPAGGVHLLTHGRVERQRFVPAWSFPPWRRVYGFRTDVEVEDELQRIVGSRRIVRVGLRLEAHYHGDTVLCAFGPGRRFLLGYRAGVEPGDWETLGGIFGDDLIELSDADASRYAANSFTHTPGGAAGAGAPGAGGASESFLVMPDGLSDRLLGAVRERNVTPVPVDVSEFLKKGGGSVKCMIGDLGVVVGDSDAGCDGRTGG